MMQIMDTAMVFCAGLGTRMRHLTADQPKAMVEVAGESLLAWRLQALKKAGVCHVVINSHYKPHAMEAYLAAYAASHPHIQLDISHETALLDTGGGLMQACPYFAEAKAIFALNCDVIWQGNLLEQLQASWNPKTMDILMVMIPLEVAHGYHGDGDFSVMHNGRLSRQNPTYVYGGVQIIKPECVAYYAAGRDVFSLSDIYRQIDEPNGPRAYGMVYEDLWLHVDSPEGVKDAEKILHEKM